MQRRHFELIAGVLRGLCEDSARCFDDPEDQVSIAESFAHALAWTNERFDRDKFKRLVHYIIWKAGKRDWFGATKLNKVLWFADARLHLLKGHSITGATYIREKYGPVPRQVMPIRAELEVERAIRITKEDKLTRMVALSAPDMRGFDPEELKVVDYWIDHIDKDHTAGTISEETHDYSWEIAKMGEEIPLHALRVTRIKESTPEQRLRLKLRAKELGLL